MIINNIKQQQIQSQNVIIWRKDSSEVSPRKLQQYLSYNFGSLVILPIPYELGEYK